MRRILWCMVSMAVLMWSGGAVCEPFPIGALFPMTGPQAYYGRLMSRGAQLAIDHLNAAGGVEGYSFKLVISDYKNVDTELAIGGAEKMVIMDRTPFMLVSFSAVILSVQPICEKARVLMINPGAYSPSLTNKPFLYNTKLIQSQMIPPMLRFLWDLGVRRIGVLFIANQAGEVPAREYVEPLWKKMGGTVAAMEAHPPGLTDFTPYLLKIKSAKADAIYDISTGQDQAYLVRNARGMGMDIPITVPDWGTDYDEIAGEAGRNVYIPGDHFDTRSPDPAVQYFVKEYESRWNEPPDIFAANYYEAVYYLLPELIKRAVKAGKDPLSGSALEESIWVEPVFKTLYGDKLTIHRDGTCDKPMAVFQIVDGVKTVVQKVPGE